MTHPDAHILELAVVGSVNKGKSSLVTTLCEIDSGLVDPLPRSTRESTQYAYDFSGAENEDPLFRLVDTPGFQQAREALAWVREQIDTGMAEPDAIREKVRDIIERFGNHPGHVFNLGHGVLPETPPEHVKLLVDTVHGVTARAAG